MGPDLEPRHFAFIVNPNAGQNRWQKFESRVIEIFAGQIASNSFEIIETTGAGHASHLAAKLADQWGGRLIAIACGGDGTANEVANGITGTAAAMGILPIGTANDFVRTAYSNQDPDWLLDRILKPDIRPIDVIRVDDRICLNITSLGFDTKVQCLASVLSRRFRWLGNFSYQLAIVRSLFGGREYPMHYRLQTLDSEGQTGILEGDANFILAAICNGRYYGGGFNPAPQARLDDGQLDFCLVDSLPLRRILPLIPLYKQGRHLSDPAVHFWQTTGGRIEAPLGQLLLGNYDGETFEKSAIDFQILPLALRFAFY